jgi:hypothetical protein
MGPESFPSLRSSGGRGGIAALTRLEGAEDIRRGVGKEAIAPTIPVDHAALDAF